MSTNSNDEICFIFKTVISKTDLRDIFKEFQIEIPKPAQQNEPQNNYGTVKWFAEIKHLAVPSVYSQLSRGEIPKDLYQKPAGTKRVLFFKDKVLNWINAGCPANVGENIHNSK